MITVLYVEINLIGMIILTVVLCNQRGLFNGYGRQRAFNALTISIIAILALDSCMWILDGKPHMRTLLEFSTWGYYFLNCFAPYLWMIYMVQFFNVTPSVRKKLALPISLPLIVHTVLLIINVKVDLFYSIGTDGAYARGPLFAVEALLAYFYTVVAFVVSLFHFYRAQAHRQRHEYAVMILIMFMPFFGSIVQILYYGLSLIWICTSLAILLIFVNFQNKQISTDSLTGLNNRYQFDKYMQSVYDHAPETGSKALLILDIDNFKAINDNYGHVEGDKALIAVADALRMSLINSRAFLSRYGGDEFAIVCDAENAKQISAAIYEALNETNRVHVTPYHLSLSVGFVQFPGGAGEPIDSIISRADEKMYADKLKNHVKRAD